MKLHIDFETRSDVNLKTSGAHVYARSPNTDILCMAWAVDDEPVQIWKKGEPFPIDLELILDECEVFAHNAPFEILVWYWVGHRRYGWPALSLKKVFCNMAQALAMGLPAALEKLAVVLKLPFEKDMAGNRVMMQLSRPRAIAEDGTITWWEPSDVPDKFEKLHSYCISDVEVERAAGKILLPLIPSERDLWLLDFEINSRGLQIDMKAVDIAVQVIEVEKERLNAKMNEITGGKVEKATATKKLTEWLKARGVDADGVAKDDILDLLSMDLPSDVREALLVRQQAAKSSTAKLAAMQIRANDDDRVRGIHQYHGAGTGRWAGRGVNFQNLPRPQLKQAEIEGVFELLHSGKPISEICELIDMIYGPVTTVISDCIRGFVCAMDACDLVAADLASIESRTLAWLAGEEKKLEIFRTHGKVYEDAASSIYRVPMDKVSKEQRQIGKVAELALGFQGGKGAFQSMAANYNVKVSDERAEEIKHAWRQANPKIVQYWHEIEAACKKSVLNPGQVYAAGILDRQVKFKVSGSFLFCRLPSGRCLCYPYPKVESKLMPWGDTRDTVTYLTEESTTNKIIRMKIYGGLLTENVTQASARDVLAEGLVRLKKHNYPVVMHVHDEAVAEVLDGFGSVEEMERLMAVVPSWATGLPIAAEGWRGFRYRK
jgi:DNA polymerase